MDFQVLGRDYDFDGASLEENTVITHIVSVPFSDICHYTEDDIATLLENLVLGHTDFVFNGFNYSLVGADEQGNALIEVSGQLDRF